MHRPSKAKLLIPINAIIFTLSQHKTKDIQETNFALLIINEI